jgi:hypothetical protein
MNPIIIPKNIKAAVIDGANVVGKARHTNDRIPPTTRIKAVTIPTTCPRRRLDTSLFKKIVNRIKPAPKRKLRRKRVPIPAGENQKPGKNVNWKIPIKRRSISVITRKCMLHLNRSANIPVTSSPRISPTEPARIKERLDRIISRRENK